MLIRVRWQKKHVFGSEGTVAGKGSHTVAFVRGLFPCFHFCLYAANYPLSLVFLRLCLTVGGMKSCRLRAISCQVTQKLKRDTTLE